MALSQPRNVYGIDSIQPYSRSTAVPYGFLRVLKTSSISLNAEITELLGGASKYPWAAEEGAISAELTINSGELPNFMFELFLGIAPTAGSAETSGSLSTLTNKYGTSIQGSSNAITSVFLLAGSAANLKFGKYVVQAVTASTFDVFFSGNPDLGRGTNGAYSTDTGKVAAAVAFTASVASVTGFGLSFAQNGTLAFTIGDSATFQVRPVNSGSSSARVGGTIDQSFPEFGAIVYSQKRGNGEMTEFDCFRCKAAGMPIPLEMAQFAQFETKVKLLYDAAFDGIFDYRFVAP